MWGRWVIATATLLLCRCLSSAELTAEEALVRVPKLEMHAHLHGSVRKSTLIELAKAANMSNAMKTSLDQYDHGVADKPFDVFPIVHSIVTSQTVVRRIVTEMIEDYQAQNCIYLEVRTTPRSLPDGTTMEEYLSLVVDVIADHNAQRGDGMLVKLIVSIDRGRKFSDGLDVLDLAKRMMFLRGQRVIVGIDFSGNPLGGRFQDFLPIFEAAREHGLNVTIHTAEMRVLSEKRSAEDLAETDAILAFVPDRMGHLLYPMERHFDKMLELKSQGRAPPVEVCPTTAFFLMGLQSYADHPHVRRLLASHYPLSINTDDSGIFSTSLTTEMSHVMTALDLRLNDMVVMTARSIAHVFASPAERVQLVSQFRLAVAALALEHPELQIDVAAMPRDVEETEEIDMSHLYTM